MLGNLPSWHASRRHTRKSRHIHLPLLSHNWALCASGTNAPVSWPISQGSSKELMHQFLRHIERTRLLIHLVDMTSSGEDDPLLSFDTVNHELLAYASGL